MRWPALQFALLSLTLSAAVGAAEMDFQITSDRGDTYRAVVTIDNPSDRKVADWSLEFTFDREVLQAFGAEFTQLAADRYRFSPTEWTKEIAPGGQAKFTFVGKPGNLKSGPQQVDLDVIYAAAAVADAGAPAPQARTVPDRSAASPPQPAEAKATNRGADAIQEDGLPHTTAFQVKNSWNNGFVAEMVVINDSDRTIAPWRLEMTLDNSIEQMWEAEYRQVGATRWLVTPKTHNQEIPPGGFVVFGFKGAAAFQARPSETRLFEGG